MQRAVLGKNQEPQWGQMPGQGVRRLGIKEHPEIETWKFLFTGRKKIKGGKAWAKKRNQSDEHENRSATARN